MPSRYVNLTKKKLPVELVEQVQRLRRAGALGVDVLQHGGVHGDHDAVVLPVVEVDEHGGRAEQQAVRAPVLGHLVAQALAHQDPRDLLDARVDVHPPQ